MLSLVLSCFTMAVKFSTIEVMLFLHSKKICGQHGCACHTTIFAHKKHVPILAGRAYLIVHINARTTVQFLYT